MKRDGGWPIRVACLGGGYHSAVGRCHNAALSLDHRLEVVAGCFSLENDENLLTASKYGLSADLVHGSFEEMLRVKPRPFDAVIVLTPTDQHAAHVVRCLDEGIPVICEKALATSSAEIDQIRSSLQAADGFLAVTYNYLGYPMLRELRAMIAAGRLGTLRHVMIEMPQEGYLRVDGAGEPIIPQSWRLTDRSVPMLSLDLGTHIHSIVRFLSGQRPSSVVATEDTFGNFEKVVDNVVSTVRYDGGLLCGVWFSKSALGHRNGLRVRAFGDRAAAEWHQMNPEFVTFCENDGRQQIIDRSAPGIGVANQDRYGRFKVGHPAGFVEAFANCYWDISEALKAHLTRDTGFRSDFVFGVDMAGEGIRMLEAMSKSAHTRQWVDV
jgi:predicted dehydrogenase